MPRSTFMVLALALVAAALLAVALGPVLISPADVFEALRGTGGAGFIYCFAAR